MPLAAESLIAQETLRRNPPNEESWSELQADCWVWISCYRSDCELRVVPNLKLVWTAVSSSSEKSAFMFTFYLFTSKTSEKYLHDKTCSDFLLHLISPKCLLLSSKFSSVVSLFSCSSTLRNTSLKVSVLALWASATASNCSLVQEENLNLWCCVRQDVVLQRWVCPWAVF